MTGKGQLAKTLKTKREIQTGSTGEGDGQVKRFMNNGHTVETLAALFLGSRDVMRTTEKQGQWLLSVIQKSCRGEYRGESITTDNGLYITNPQLRGRHSDFKIETQGHLRQA